MAQRKKGNEGQRGRHAQAAKAEKPAGKGFHGHPEEHAKAGAKSHKAQKDESLIDKLNPMK